MGVGVVKVASNLRANIDKDKKLFFLLVILLQDIVVILLTAVFLSLFTLTKQFLSNGEY